MTSSIAKKFIFTPVLVSTATFVILTLPLSVFGSKLLNVKVQDEPVFFGQVEEFAPQYLSIAGAMSIGAGIVSLMMLGWRESSRKSTQVEKELSSLAQNFQDTQELLDALEHAQSQLHRVPEKVSIPSTPVFQQETLSPVQPFVISTSPISQTPVNVPTITADLTATPETIPSSPSSTPMSEVEQLDSELQQMMEHIALMRQTLRSNPQVVTSFLRQTKKTA